MGGESLLMAVALRRGHLRSLVGTGGRNCRMSGEIGEFWDKPREFYPVITSRRWVFNVWCFFVVSVILLLALLKISVSCQVQCYALSAVYFALFCPVFCHDLCLRWIDLFPLSFAISSRFGTVFSPLFSSIPIPFPLALCPQAGVHCRPPIHYLCCLSLTSWSSCSTQPSPSSCATPTPPHPDPAPSGLMERSVPTPAPRAARISPYCVAAERYDTAKTEWPDMSCGRPLGRG